MRRRARSGRRIWPVWNRPHNASARPPRTCACPATTLMPCAMWRFCFWQPRFCSGQSGMWAVLPSPALRKRSTAMPGRSGKAGLTPGPTGLPGLYLNDQPQGRLQVVEGSRIDLRLLPPTGRCRCARPSAGNRLTRLWRTPSNPMWRSRTGWCRSKARTGQGPNGMLSSCPTSPRHSRNSGDGQVGFGRIAATLRGLGRYGVVSGIARFELDLKAVPRRHGLAPEPDPRDPVTLDLPLTISGDRRDFDETLIENLATTPGPGCR